MRVALLAFLTSVVAQLYNPLSVQDAWDNHFAAFGLQDLDQIMLDYTEESVAVVWDVAGQNSTADVYNGTSAIRGLFTDLFRILNDTSTLDANVVVDDDGMVFLLWECPSSGIYQATDSFFFEADYKIKYQDIVVNSQTQRRRRRLADYNPLNSSEAWTNHFDAFGAQDVDKIMLDYDDNSEVRVFNFADSASLVETPIAVYNTTAAIRTMFMNLFADIWNQTTLGAPLVHQDTDLVFLVWEVPGTGIKWATDSFSFENNKIRFQNIALDYTRIENPYAPTSTQEAWDNHFAAFGSQNLDQIMWDYTEESVAVVYDVNDAANPDRTATTYTGISEIRGMFAYFFSVLTNLDSLAAQPVVDDNMVFLLWECPSSGIYQATDSFVFDANHTVKYQDIVINTGTDRRRLADYNPRRLADYNPANSSEAWDNHFAAFGAQDVDKIMLDYDDNSEVRTFNFADSLPLVDTPIAVYNTTAAIRQFFLDLFSDIWSETTLAAPLTHQDIDLVFLVWEVPEVGFKVATDTFSFANNKIRHQNIAFDYTRITPPTSNTTQAPSSTAPTSNTTQAPISTAPPPTSNTTQAPSSTAPTSNTTQAPISTAPTSNTTQAPSSTASSVSAPLLLCLSFVVMNLMK